LAGSPAAAHAQGRNQILPPPGVPGSMFPWYLVCVGLFAVLFYVSMSCQVQDIALTRYTLLALFAPVGLVAWLLRAARSRVVRATVMVAALGWTAGGAIDHARLLDEYVRHPPPDEFRELTQFLIDHHVQYGRAPYWTAYAVDFFSNERVILAATDFVRITEYTDLVDQHAAQAAVISEEQPCVNPRAVPFRRWCVTLRP
jgi:hypothetical protein